MSQTAHGDALDNEGLHVERPESISTWNGRIDPLQPDPSEINVLDIAHATSRLCRYNGHTGGFLSVARHSIWVSEYLENLGATREIVLQGLLHDGAEAYLSDVPRPVKRAPEMEVFRTFDARMDAAVMEAFGLPYPLPKIVMEADRRILVDKELPAPDGARYTWDSTPEQDEADFLARFMELTGETLPRLHGRALVIGLSGYAQSGKDTTARVLMEHFGFQRIAFADKLREMLYALNPLVPNEVRAGYGSADSSERLSVLVNRVGWEAAKQHPEVRSLLQRLGTEAGRNVLGDDVWVRAAMSGVERGGRYVFTDVRFPNEYDAIRAAGGEVWRVQRPGRAAVNRHPSETALDAHDFDRQIWNDAGVLELDRAVHSAAAGLFLRR